MICEAQILQELIFSWYFSSWMVDVLWKEQIPGCYGSLKVLKKWVKKGKHKCKSQTVCLYLGLPLGYFWLCCLFKSLLKSCSICPSEYMLTCTLHCCRGANSALEALVVFNLFAVWKIKPEIEKGLTEYFFSWCYSPEVKLQQGCIVSIALFSQGHGGVGREPLLLNYSFQRVLRL